MAVNRTWTDADGNRKDKTTWFRVSAWQKLAEIVSQHLKKGSKVMVIGEVEEASVYTGKDGKAAASLEITAKTIKFLDNREDKDESSMPF